MNNTVELLGHYGSDKTHAASAWTSTVRDLTPDKIERIPKLLEFLVKGSDGKSHETPFEKSMLHFLVVSDVASHIHKIKHRIAVSVNGESARYKELPNDRAYIPPDWPEEWRHKLSAFANNAFALYHECNRSLIEDYGFDKKRAKESSRYFIPYCNQTTVDIAFNFRSFVHFCKLRAVPGAQYEIRQIALQMIEQVHNIEGNPFEHSLRVWGLTDLLKQAMGPEF